MTLADDSGGTGASLLEDVFIASLPKTTCTACGDDLPRRSHRVMVRASWRPATENLCPSCWSVITEWAARFALRQADLPGF